jgi:3-methyladenine DNA glycosylase AlkD
MSEDIGAIVKRVRRELARLGLPARVAGARRYFVNQHYGGYGVPAPQVKQIAGSVYREVRQWPIAGRDGLCTELWEGGSFEEGAIVCYVYRRFQKTCGEREFRLFTRWLDKYVHNWGHTDGLALWLLGACVQNDPDLIARLYKWVGARNRWKRRAAAVTLVYSARRGEHIRQILDIAGGLIGDPCDMVQKGAGWLLKEAYPKHPSAVMHFLMPRRGKTTRLVLRYAAEKMSVQDRTRLLAR